MPLGPGAKQSVRPARLGRGEPERSGAPRRTTADVADDRGEGHATGCKAGAGREWKESGDDRKCTLKRLCAVVWARS